MSEHDEAGSACAFPPLLPPPPPQPAARSASTAVRPISAASNGLLLTLPPRSPIPVATPHAPRGPAPRGRKYRGIPPANASPNRRYSGFPAEVAELVDAPDSKSGGGNLVWVRVPPSASDGLRRGVGRPDPRARGGRARRDRAEDVRRTGLSGQREHVRGGQRPGRAARPGRSGRNR